MKSYSPELKGDVLYLSDEAISLLINAGVERRVVEVARYGYMVDTLNTSAVQTAFEEMLAKFAAQSPNRTDD